MILPTQDILPLIPQRSPFVMIDKLLSSTDDNTVTSLQVKADNVLVSDGELSEAGLTENIAQTAAADAGYAAQQLGKPVQPGFIGAVKNLEVFALPKVGDTIETEVKIENQVFDVTIIKGKITCKGITIAQCEMKIFIQPQ
ncbi:putative hotdog family 3-hydroxylacyl-ACP dehydratase [Mucilaginibacter sp. SG538B]|uniref:3-hydroxyacyl-ACP dehydratase n=1 Tax=Mucilaginibacter sp. SG538B TaxID=2587021 RepID=UPI00159E4822|nr:3-hydroxyacyl-ACP dehydratase [Mucilaginibacter sp. SG538B]NVM64815.1 putative hotdog family 3-hydroxylacyl-ACP dehydratase [Mucilaginibacter sp. SG538B]